MSLFDDIDCAQAGEKMTSPVTTGQGEELLLKLSVISGEIMLYDKPMSTFVIVDVCIEPVLTTLSTVLYEK